MMTANKLDSFFAVDALCLRLFNTGRLAEGNDDPGDSRSEDKHNFGGLVRYIS